MSQSSSQAILDTPSAGKKLSPSQVAGTAAWMSPEMMLNDEKLLGKPTDVFSYGVIVWEMLTRQLPFHKMNDFQVSRLKHQDYEFEFSKTAQFL